MNRSETGRKIAQSTHENEYIKQEKTFCRNSKQFLNAISNCIFVQINVIGYEKEYFFTTHKMEKRHKANKENRAGAF